MNLVHAVNLDAVEEIEKITAVLSTLPGITDVIITMDRGVLPRYYARAVRALKAIGKNIWLRPCDSSEMSRYTRRQYAALFSEVLHYHHMDIVGIEVGNEVTGAWLGQFVHDKVLGALAECAKFPKVTTAITYYLDGDAPYSIDNFFNKYPPLPSDCDFISYYERSSTKASRGILDHAVKVLAERRPEAMLGIGEYGAEDAHGKLPSHAVISELVSRYERLDFVDRSKWIGFYGYWDFVNHACLDGFLAPTFQSLYGTKKEGP